MKKDSMTVSFMNAGIVAISGNEPLARSLNDNGEKASEKPAARHFASGGYVLSGIELK